MNHPNDPTNPDTAWEEAMSRDFDARVRDLHEAPLDISSVKGKAHKIKRNRRAAVAGGILGVAAIITPIAVLANGGDNTNSEKPPFVNDPTKSETIADPTEGLDYVEGRTWHQADGDVVDIPKGDYYEAGIWDGKLVTLQVWGPDRITSQLQIFDETGDEVGSYENVVGFAVSDDGSILAYTDASGPLIALWEDGGRSVLADDVVDSGGGESIGGTPVSVLGTAPCTADNGNCLVRINNYESGCVDIGSGGPPKPSDALSCGDEQGDLMVYVNDLTDEGYRCGAIRRGLEDTPASETCDYDLQDLSPDGRYVVGGQVDSDGLGPKEVSILDVETGDAVSSYTAPTDSAFLWSDIAWSTSGHLLVSEWDNGQWRLLAIDPATEEITEVAGPAPGDEFSNPFLLIHH